MDSLVAVSAAPQVMLLECEGQARQRLQYVIGKLVLTSTGLLLMLLRARAGRQGFRRLSETDGLSSRHYLVIAADEST